MSGIPDALDPVDPDGIDCPFADAAAWGILRHVEHPPFPDGGDLRRRTDGLRPRIVGRCAMATWSGSVTIATPVVDYVVREVAPAHVLASRGTAYAPDRDEPWTPRGIAAALRERPAITPETAGATLEWLDAAIERWDRQRGSLSYPATLCDVRLCLQWFCRLLGAAYWRPIAHPPRDSAISPDEHFRPRWLMVDVEASAAHLAGREAAFIASAPGHICYEEQRTWGPAVRVLRMLAGDP